MHRTPSIYRSLLPLTLVACAARPPASTRASAAARPAASAAPPRSAAVAPVAPPDAAPPEAATPPADATTDAARDALRRAPVPACLRGAERVVVTGRFDAEAGAIHVERTEPSPGLRPEASRCVARALSDPHVAPGGSRHDFCWTFRASDATASPEGQIDARQVTASLRERLEAIEACYETRLRSRPGRAGRVLVWFTVDTRGVVTRAVARASSADLSDVGECILQQIRGAAMPRATGGDVELSFPFTFGSGAATGGAPTASSDVRRHNARSA